MLSYFIKRSMISLKQRKLWFLLPLLLSIGYACWLFFSSPRIYQINRTYQTPAAVPNAGKEINLVELWHETIDIMPLGNQFINSKIREISKNRRIIQAWTNDPQNRDKAIAARRSGSIGRFVVNDIKDHFTILEVLHEEGKDPSWIRFSYRGSNQELGSQLVDFYSQALVDQWQEELDIKLKREKRILDRLSALTVNDEEDEEEEENLAEVSPLVLKKMQQRQASVDLLGVQLALLRGQFSAIERIVMDRKLSDGIVIRSLVCLILTILATAIVLTGVEFSSKSFTTELQVSQYLDIRLIGTIRKIDALEA